MNWFHRGLLRCRSSLVDPSLEVIEVHPKGSRAQIPPRVATRRKTGCLHVEAGVTEVRGDLRATQGNAIPEDYGVLLGVEHDPLTERREPRLGHDVTRPALPGLNIAAHHRDDAGRNPKGRERARERDPELNAAEPPASRGLLQDRDRVVLSRLVVVAVSPPSVDQRAEEPSSLEVGVRFREATVECEPRSQFREVRMGCRWKHLSRDRGIRLLRIGRRPRAVGEDHVRRSATSALAGCSPRVTPDLIVTARVS